MTDTHPEPAQHDLEMAAVRAWQTARRCLKQAEHLMLRTGHPSLAECCRMQAEDCDEDVRALLDVTVPAEVQLQA